MQLQYAGQEILICTYWGQNPTFHVKLLPHLWVCTLVSFIPEFYLKAYYQL